MSSQDFASKNIHKILEVSEKTKEEKKKKKSKPKQPQTPFSSQVTVNRQSSDAVDGVMFAVFKQVVPWTRLPVCTWGRKDSRASRAWPWEYIITFAYIAHDLPAPFDVSGNSAPQISGKWRICQHIQHF